MGKIQKINQKYIENIMMVISSLQDKIEKCEIQFNLLFPYFKEGRQMEEILKKKISIIFLNDVETSIKYYRILKSKVMIIIKIKEELTLICRFFFDFYPNIHSEDLRNISKIIIALDENSLNYFELNYSKDYEKYEKYLDEAEKSLEKKSSIFYNQILNDSRKTYKNDDIKCIEETNKKFNELRYLFEKDGIDKIDEKILIICAMPFIEEKEEITSELKQLMKIFKISRNNNEIDNIKNDIILL